MAKLELACAQCGKPVLRWPSEIGQTTYCSRECSRYDTTGLAKAIATRRARCIAQAEQRFWAKVDRRGPGECWEWLGTRLPKGYGQHCWQGKPNTYAHRIALALKDGDWDSPLAVCHTCDNPPCCNPVHLWRGTLADNLADMRAKGRAAQPKGEQHPHAKLTEADVIAIRASSGFHRIVAARYGVATPVITNIKNRKTWKHIP